MENFNLNNCYIKAFNASYDRISYETWDEFYTAVKGTKVTKIDLCCREGYVWQKTADDGTFIYHSWSGDEVINISDGNDIIKIKYNPMKNEPTDDTTVRLSTSSADMLQYITGITATPLSLAPPKPDKPSTLKTYPDEVLENVYIDDWAIVFNAITQEKVKRVADYNTVKDFLDKSSGRTKKAITLQAQKGFNFSLSDDDGSITFYNGETYTFKYMYDNGIPVGDEPPYNEPDSYRERTYPDAKKFIFLKGEDYIDDVDEYIVIRSYDHESIDIDLMSHGLDYRLIKMLSETSTDSPPFNGIDENRISEINCHALIPVTIPLKNDAFTTYILSGEQMNNLRDNMVIYNDMVINTYNYPIPFNPDSLLDADMKIGTADTNIPVKEFKQITNEIQIFEFTIPELPDVNLVTLFPIFKEGITLTYDIIRGKVIKGISVYDCLSNTNYLKIYADDVLIDYISYNIQTQIPINWDNVRLENKGTIGQRIPCFKSYIIIQYDKLEQVIEFTKGYIRGSVKNLDSLILKDEISIMDSLFKGGVYYNRNYVGPNIPTDGLVCYLDAKGKKNTDIYKKNTLVDLSGNGNHGTLHNFSFTDGSGYENGGLKFDGVDDTLSYSHDIKETDPRTIFIDFELEQTATEQGADIALPFGIYVHRANDYVYNFKSNSYFGYPARIPKGTHKFVITIESTVETGKMYYLGKVIPNKPNASVGNYHYDPKMMDSSGKRKLNRAMLWNRVLTEQEITKLMEVSIDG